MTTVVAAILVLVGLILAIGWIFFPFLVLSRLRTIEDCLRDIQRAIEEA